MQTQETATSYRTIAEGGQGEVTEKKSRFLAQVQPVESEEQALAFLESVRKKYWDASHHCFAYILGRRGEIVRSGDDGEPAGTAGHPILEVLSREGLTNVILVVTRYFGGTLLGTGGLARAYTAAAREGLQNCRPVTMSFGSRLTVAVEYALLGKVQYLLENSGIKPEEIRYDDRATFLITVRAQQKERLLAQLREATAAQAEVCELEQLYFVDKQKN